MASIKSSYSLYKSKLEKFLYEKNTFTDILEKVETKTKVNRVNLVLGLHAVLVLYLAVGYGAQFLCNFIGFLYPAYASVKAIETKAKDDDTKWLTYWVVYSAFSLVEFFTDIFLFWVPFYWLLKCIFFVWLMAPMENNGSVVMYYRIIRPFVLRHEKKIDAKLADLSDTAGQAFDEAQKAAANAGSEYAMGNLKVE